MDSIDFQQQIDSVKCGLTIPCVSVKHILYDIEDCITTSDQKVAKRLARLRAVLTMCEYNPDYYISQLKICEERSMQVADGDILKFVSHAIEESSTRVEFRNDEVKDDTIKKVIEAELTSRLNRTIGLYKITCNLMARIWKRIQRHSIFGSLCKAQQILLVHKGGIAQRLVLLEEFPEHKDLIEQNFKLGGDNDVNIIINPILNQYDEIRSLLVDYVHHCLIEFAGTFSCGTVATRAKEITSIRVGGLDLPVQSCERNHFTIRPDGDVSYLDTDIMKEGVFTSYNDSLKFEDAIGRTSHFTLLRIKKAFRVGKRILGAELLDIAVPHRDESKMNIEAFHKYQSGMWIKHITI